MAIEYLEGKNLVQLVEERGALPEIKALEYIKQVGKALGKLHRSQLLHCNVKPENAIVCQGVASFSLTSD